MSLNKDYLYCIEIEWDGKTFHWRLKQGPVEKDKLDLTQLKPKPLDPYWWFDPEYYTIEQAKRKMIDACIENFETMIAKLNNQVAVLTSMRYEL